MAQQAVESQLLAEGVRRLDLSDFCIVTADSSIREVVEQMRERGHNCALIVGERTRLTGILTDRDVLRKVVHRPEIWDDPVSTIMTAAPQTIDQEGTAKEALRLMDQGGFRNVPVVRGNGAIVGNVTYFSILKFLTDHFPEAVYNLPPDPTNYADRRDGG